MVIKNLKLRNYRRFAELDIEFPENVIGIIGPNGAGKSTIIEALGWCLYGSRISRTDKGDIRSQYAADSAPCSGELIFQYGGSEFRLVRHLKGKNAIAEAAIYRDAHPKPVAERENGVNKYIENLLRLDYPSFLVSVFARQKDLASFSAMQPNEKKKTINRLIDIDRIDEARKRAGEDRRAKSNFLEGQKKHLKNMDELVARKRQIESIFRSTEDRLKKLRQQIDRQTVELKKVTEEFATWNLKRDQFLQQQHQIDGQAKRLQDQQNSLMRKQAELAEIAKAEAELVLLNEKLRDYERIKIEKERLDQEKTRQATLDGYLTSKAQKEKFLVDERQRQEKLIQISQNETVLNERLQQLNKDIKTFELQIAELQKAQNDATAHKKTAENNGKDLKRKLDRIQELGPEGQCPVCTQRLGDHFESVVQEHFDLLEKLRIEFSKYRHEEELIGQKLAESNQNLAQLRDQKDTCLSDLSRAREGKQQLLETEKRLATEQNDYQSLLQRIADFGPVNYDADLHLKMNAEYQTLTPLSQKQVQLMERTHRRAALLDDIAASEEMIADLQKALAELNQKQQDLAFDEPTYLQAKQAVDAQTGAINTSKEKYGEIRAEQARNQAQLDFVEKELQEQIHLREEIKGLENDLVYLAALDMHFDHFRLELGGRIRPLLAMRTSELLGLTTNQRYTNIELDEDYNIRIYDGNRDFPIEHFSGGEQDLTNLCLRIAISQIVVERSGGAPINFVVLDEIFGSQDSERRNLILNALGNLSSQFRQVFIITHIETIKDLLPVIYEVKAVDDRYSQAVLC